MLIYGSDKFSTVAQEKGSVTRHRFVTARYKPARPPAAPTHPFVRAISRVGRVRCLSSAPLAPRSRTKPVRGGRIPLYARGTVRSQQIAQPSARRGPRASGPSIPYPGHPTNQISAISRTTVQYTGPRMGPSDDRSKYGGERRGAAWQVQRTACCVQAGQLAWCHLSVSLSLSFSLSLSLSISLTHVRS